MRGAGADRIGVEGAAAGRLAAVSGVSLVGLRMVVQPAASAGASFLVAMAAGKFHGVISRETPIGCRSTTMRLSPAGERR